jgi:polysaccharide export outer membrane protein
LAVVVIAVCAIGCRRNPGRFVWVDQYAEPPAVGEKPYVIGVGDVIQVRVFNQDQLSARVKVRNDGRVSLPLLNDVDAAGYTPVVLAGILETRLKELVKAPSVTVSLEETKPQTVMVIGEVVRPNSYPLDVASGVLQALAVAGGLKDDASSNRIFVHRQNPAPALIRFSYESLLNPNGRAASFKLRPGDVVVVE